MARSTTKTRTTSKPGNAKPAARRTPVAPRTRKPAAKRAPKGVGGFADVNGLHMYVVFRQ